MNPYPFSIGFLKVTPERPKVGSIIHFNPQSPHSLSMMVRKSWFSRPWVLFELNGNCEFLDAFDILLQVGTDVVP